MTMSTHLLHCDLHLRHPGLTKPVADGYAEAASVCLHRHHEPPAEYDVWNGDEKQGLLLDWNTPDERCLAAWGNEIDTTEAGAVGLVLTALETCVGLVAVRRAETLTGCDYYVGPHGTGRNDLEQCSRLEISGVDHGPASKVYRRVAEKIEQAIRGESNLPALVGVVGFKARLIVFEPVEDE
jgi:hypothetical protein